MNASSRGFCHSSVNCNEQFVQTHKDGSGAHVYAPQAALPATSFAWRSGPVLLAQTCSPDHSLLTIHNDGKRQPAASPARPDLGPRMRLSPLTRWRSAALASRCTFACALCWRPAGTKAVLDSGIIAALDCLAGSKAPGHPLTAPGSTSNSSTRHRKVNSSSSSSSSNSSNSSSSRSSSSRNKGTHGCSQGGRRPAAMSLTCLRL